MVFSSLSFLFCFFPAFLLVYYLTPSRPAGARNAVLLAGSSVFYIIGLDGQWAYFALLAASVLVNYGLGLAIVRDKPRAKLWLILGICYNFLWLFLFKYLNFVLTGVNGALGLVSGGKAAIPLLRWALPVGISFYTFSAVGYLMDVYRGTVAPERSLLTFGTYLTMFPKLVSGPIASYTELQPEFGARNVSLRQAVDGLKLFVFGMALKVLLANQLGDLKRLLPGYAAVGVGREDGAEAGEFSAVFYRRDRFTPLESGTFWLSETPDVAGSKGWDGACERVATWVVLHDREGGREFLFVNTHLDHVGQVARDEGVNLLRERIEALRGDRPVILTGDFNSEPGSSVVAHVQKDGVLHDVKQVAARKSGTEWSFSDFGQILEAERPLLDYIFVSDGIAADLYEVLPDTLGGGYVSDHAPVMAIVKFEK